MVNVPDPRQGKCNGVAASESPITKTSKVALLSRRRLSRFVGAIERKFSPTRADVIRVACLVALITAIFGYAIRRNILIDDYPAHIQLAQDMASSKTTVAPHFLFQLLVISVHGLIPCKQFTILGVAVSCFTASSFYLAGFAATLLSYLCLGIVIYALLRREFGSLVSQNASSAYVPVTLGLMLVSPISLFTLPTQSIYLGYIGINVYHNPTSTLLKPLALLLFSCASKAFTLSRNSLTLVMASATLTVLATLAKPSYTICLLPALAILTAYHIWRKKMLDWRLLTLGILIPALIVLGWQYDVTYKNPILHDASSIVFAPFKVMSHYKTFASEGYLGLFVRFVLSILFPVCVAALYFKVIGHDTKLFLAWLAFGVGAFYSYGLAESGARLLHGNFLWSGQITLFILFLTSTSIFMRQTLLLLGRNSWFQAGKGRLCVCAGVFGLHLISGVVWYDIMLGPQNRQWW